MSAAGSGSGAPSQRGGERSRAASPPMDAPRDESEENPPLFAENPFVMPDDDELETARERIEARKALDKARAQRSSVRDKTTFTSAMGGTMAATLRAAGGKEPVVGRVAGAGSLVSDPNEPPPPRKEKEHLHDFIAKKREIFLVQMALDTKRAEIRKLEERALQREEALTKSEEMLEDDALRFDGFLKDNDMKVQEAIRNGELAAKAKHEKLQEIKKLNANVSIASSELGKTEDQLNDCATYQRFLDALTPPEFFAEQAAIRAARREARRAARREVRDAYANAIQNAADLEADLPRLEAAVATASRLGRKAEDRARAELEAASEAAKTAREAIPERSPPPTPECDDSDEEIPMYYRDARALPALYNEMEEQNLFLIQNMQETEEALEEIQNRARETRERMEAETDALEAQAAALRAAIAAEEDKAAEIARRGDPGKGSLAGAKPSAKKKKSDSEGKEKKPAGAIAAGSNIPLEKLTEKVAEVYQRCGFPFDPSMSTIQMLTNIESKLESILAVADSMPKDVVEHAEKAQEKVRRSAARLEKIAEDEQAAIDKAAKSLARATAPVKKKVGKPQMTRSLPPSRKKKEVVVNMDKEEEELKAFLALDF